MLMLHPSSSSSSITIIHHHHPSSSSSIIIIYHHHPSSSSIIINHHHHHPSIIIISICPVFLFSTCHTIHSGSLGLKNSCSADRACPRRNFAEIIEANRARGCVALCGHRTSTTHNFLAKIGFAIEISKKYRMMRNCWRIWTHLTWYRDEWKVVALETRRCCERVTEDSVERESHRDEIRVCLHPQRQPRTHRTIRTGVVTSGCKTLRRRLCWCCVAVMKGWSASSNALAFAISAFSRRSSWHVPSQRERSTLLHAGLRHFIWRRYPFDP